MIWDRARDIVQILIIPTIMWSLWVSRGVEIQRLQIEQSTAYLRIPTAMTLVDARSAAKTMSLRIVAHSGTTALRLQGVRVDYLGDSWVSAISVEESP